jgi:hypothetical protein
MRGLPGASGEVRLSDVRSIKFMYVDRKCFCFDR